MSKGWIGVDFDGTLAHYTSGDIASHGPQHCGPPIPEMVARIRGWLAEGKDVRIFTARVWYGQPGQHPNWEEFWLRQREATTARDAIAAWCLKHIGVQLPITCEKDYNMIELWDDRVIQVIPNTGQLATDTCPKWFTPPRGFPQVKCTLHKDHDGICDASERILRIQLDHERQFIDSLLDPAEHLSIIEAIREWRKENG